MNVSAGMARVAELAARFELDEEQGFVTSPLIIAIEAVVCAEQAGILGPMATAQAAMAFLPSNTTNFERGLAFGLAIALMTELVAGETSLAKKPSHLSLVT